jgi:hypothetical protein
MRQICICIFILCIYGHIHECLDVHIGMGNSRSDMDEHCLLHDRFMPDTIRMIIWKKPNSGYDYMHIRVLSGFICRIFNISGQHWFLPTQVGTWLTNTGKRPWPWALPKSGQVSYEKRKRKFLSWLRPHSWGFYWNQAYAQLCWNRIYCNNFTILARIKKIDQQLAW